MIIKFIHRCLINVIDVFFPLKCLGCGKNESYLCEKCKEKLIASNSPVCLNINISVKSKKQQDANIEKIKVFSALSYKDVAVKKLIWHLKYRNKKQIGEILASIIVAKFNFLKNSSDKIIIPIPMSKKKLKQRGYNQAALIAQNLSLKTGIPVFQNILIKKFNTLSQVEAKTKKERIKNLNGSFEITKNFLPYDFKNKTVLLLDDVITTGTTLSEAAKTLKSAGFKKIIGITATKG